MPPPTPAVSATPPLRSRAYEASHVEVGRDGVVEGLMVPWETPTDVVDLINGKAVAYREQFTRGAFRRAAKVPNRVGLSFTHSELMPDRMGYGLEFRDSDEGAIGVWKLYNYAREQAEELLTTTHTGLSVTFDPLWSAGTETEGALVTRSDVGLAYVAATDHPAYADARVLSLREHDQRLAEDLERQREREAARVELLRYLHASGRPLTTSQLSYLSSQGITLGAS